MAVQNLLLLLLAVSPGRVQPDNFTYMGAFALPVGSSRPETFEYGGEAMTFRASGDPLGDEDGFPGSLFVMGHNRMPWGELPDGCMIAEISIPHPSISSNVNDLNRAEFLQPFNDVDPGLFSNFDEIPRAGMEFLDTDESGPLLHICFGEHMEEGSNQTHGFLSPYLSSSSMNGGWFIENASAYSANDYIFSIPVDWAEKHTDGKLLATGRFRDGGWSGMGPSLYAYTPWTDDRVTPEPPGSQLASVTLLQYESSENTDSIVRCLDGYQHPDEWTGGAWIVTESGKQAVLFAGTKGTGDLYWYGYINPEGPEVPLIEEEMRGLFDLCRSSDGEPFSAQASDCEPSSMRGWWSSSFTAGFLLYDPCDIGKVADGELEPWEPQPYAFIHIDEHLFHNPDGIELEMLGSGTQRRFRLGDAAWDYENGLLYVLELFADGAAPVVHVWSIH